MAGISISSIVGDNGVIVKARKASNETTKAQIQEELQLKIIDLQIEKEKTGEKITNSDIENALGGLEGIEVDGSGKNVEGEYKEHGYKVDDNYNVIVTDKLTGDKPEGRAEVITKAENLDQVQIQVIGNLNGGEIESIEALDGAELLERKSNSEYIFIVSDNLTYTFRIKGSNGRNTTVTCSVDNAVPVRDDLLTAVAMINKTGLKKVKVIGQVNSDTEEYDEVKYSLNTTVYEGNMILDGKTDYPGITRSATTYSVGSSSDVGTANSYAQNTVVLKVVGDLTINSDVTLTSVIGTNGGPKGLIVYCTGTLYNYGNISMTNRGAYAEGENVYLFKEKTGAYQYVPALGGEGGNGVYRHNSAGCTVGEKGEDGVKRGTGGGSGGSVMISSSGSRRGGGTSGNGGYGLSYAGGAGGGCVINSGSCSSAIYVENLTAPWVRGSAGRLSSSGSWEPSSGWTEASSYTNLAGGLLVLYSKTIFDLGYLHALGASKIGGGDSYFSYKYDCCSAGGGSINVFYENLLDENLSVGNTSTTSVATYRTYGGTGDFEIGKIEGGLYYSLGM